MYRGDCKHFDGIGLFDDDKRCEAGVRYRDIEDRTGGPLRLPCLPNNAWPGHARPCATACSKFEAMTAEDEDARVAMFARALDEAEAGRCPQCGADLVVLGSDHSVAKWCPAHGLVFHGCGRHDA